MKVLSFFLFIAVVAVSALYKPNYNINDAPALFEKFVKDYNRHYKDEADREEHYQAFVENLKVIIRANKKSKLASFDINKFADYTKEESKTLTGLKETIPASEADKN